MFYLERIFEYLDQKKAPPDSVEAGGVEPDLLGRSLISRCCRSARAARSCEEGRDSGNDGEFDHVHISSVVYWLL